MWIIKTGQEDCDNDNDPNGDDMTTAHDGQFMITYSLAFIPNEPKLNQFILMIHL